MISTRTVLVLGAGASAHLRYPLGIQLVSQLCQLKGSNFLDTLPSEWSPDEAKNLLNRLSKSGHYSIDAFLERLDGRSVSLGRYLIALVLKRLENLDGMFPPHCELSWYQQLFNAVLSPNGDPYLSCDSLSVITFNYDRSLEAYLHTALQNRFGLTADAALVELSKLKIIHVHGVLGEYPQVPYSDQASPEILLSISQKIKIIHELKEERGSLVSREFHEARELLMAAKRIIFMGFGFHRDNVRRLGFSPAWMSKEIALASAIGNMGKADKQRISAVLLEYGFPDPMRLLGEGFDCNHFFSHSHSLEA